MKFLIVSLLAIVPATAFFWGTGCNYCTQTASGYPVYGMAPYASSAVAYSRPAATPTYSYAPYSVSSSPGYQYVPLTSRSVAASSIDFDSLPYLSEGYAGAPVAVRYYAEPYIVDVDADTLRPLGPAQQLARVPIYGKVRGYNLPTRSAIRTGLYEPVHRPVKYESTSDADPSRAYHPAYSNWNKQPIQAVYREIEVPVTGNNNDPVPVAPVASPSIPSVSDVDIQSSGYKARASPTHMSSGRAATSSH